MESNKPGLFLIPIVLAIAFAGSCPLAPTDLPSVPLDSRSLSAIRGSDAQYQSTTPSTCQGSGVAFLNLFLPQNNGTSWVPASGCGVANIGFGCGNCTGGASGVSGVPPARHVNGTGQTTVLQNCGNVQAGTCGVTNPGGYPLNYACQGMQPVPAPNGQPYACSDIPILQGQAGGGPGGTQ